MLHTFRVSISQCLLLIVCMLAASAQEFAPAGAGGRVLYVATAGNDASEDPTQPGTPLKTIQKAASMVQPGDTIAIRGGVYRESVRLNVAATEEKPVLVVPAGKGMVIINGTETIEALKADGATWKQEGKVYSIQLKDSFDSKLNQDEQLFIDGEMMVLARYPNIEPGCEIMQPGLSAYLTIDRRTSENNISGQTEWGPIRKGGAKRVGFTDAALTQPAGFFDDASIWIKPEENRSWGFGMVGPVTKHTKGALEIQLADRVDSFYDFHNGHTRYFLYDSKNLLDAPREWWLDKASKTLYVITPDGSSPAEHRVEMKRRDYAFDLSESSYVTVRGLYVFGATITTDNVCGDGIGGGAWLTHNRGSVDIPKVQDLAPAHHVTIDQVMLKYISHFNGTHGNTNGQWLQSSGVILSGTDHVVSNCGIEYSAGNGISMYGHRHKAFNNVIHDVNYSAALASGIYFCENAGNTPGDRILPLDYDIHHNTLYRAAWGLIDASNLYSSDKSKPSRVHHNFIDAPGLMTKDVGGIRFVGHTKSPHLTNGTRIDHNLVRGCVAALGNSIYFDFNNGYVVDHNIAWHGNNLLNINDAADMLVEYNTGYTLQGGIGGYVPRSKFEGVVLRKNLTNQGLPRKNRYPALVFEDNVANADLHEYCVDPDNADFRLKPNAKAKDVGAIPAGTEDWTKGVGANWVIEEAPSDLKAAPKSDGSVVLTWKDNSKNEKAFVVERGYKTDHPNGGWEYIIVGRTQPNATTFTDQISGAYLEYFYRVRTTRSYYCEPLVLKAGQTGGKKIGFESGSGFKTGDLVGQMNWVGVDGGRGPGAAHPESFEIVQDNGNARLEITGGGTVAALGSMTMVDDRFRPGQSKLRFSIKIGLKELKAGDQGKAVKIQVGGISYWRGPNDAVCTLEVARDGTLKWSWMKVATLDTGKMHTISGIANLAAGRIESLTLNGNPMKVQPKLLGIGKKNRAVTNALWTIESGAAGPQHAVYIDDLLLEVTE